MILRGSAFNRPDCVQHPAGAAAACSPDRSTADGLRGERQLPPKDASGKRPNEGVKESLPDLESSPRAKETRRPPATLLGDTVMGKANGHLSPNPPFKQEDRAYFSGLMAAFLLYFSVPWAQRLFLSPVIPLLPVSDRQ